MKPIGEGASPVVAGQGASASNTERWHRRFGALVRERWPVFVALVAALFVIDLLYARSMLAGFELVEYLRFAIPIVFKNSVVGPTLVFAVVIGVEALRWSGRARVAATLVLLPLAAYAGISLAVRLSEPSAWTRMAGIQMLSSGAFILRTTWLHSAFGLLLVGYFAVREREAVAMRAAHAATLERESARKALAESRLALQQARVEPELLFAVLAEVRRRYTFDRRQAESLLDDMIVYLRAALPEMRGGASTLAREAALSQAYLKVLQAGRADRPDVFVRIPDELASCSFPPLVLLPLMHAAATARLTDMTLEARADDEAPGCTSLTLRGACFRLPDGWSERDLHAIHERLTSHFGESAAIFTRTVVGNACVSMRWQMEARAV